MKRILSLMLAMIVLISTAAAVTAAESDGSVPQENAAAQTDMTDVITQAEPQAQEPAVSTGMSELAPVEQGTDGVISAVTAIDTCDGGLKVSWNGAGQAAKFRLFFRTADSDWQRVGDTADTSLNHTGLVSGTEYTYTVRALDADNKYLGNYDTVGMTAVYYDTPALTSVTSVFSGQQVAWEPVDGVVFYRVFVRSGSNWRTLAVVSDTVYTNTDTVSGTAYTYTVRAVSEDGGTMLSHFVRKGITGTYVASPLITSVATAAGGLKVNWSASAGAAKYRLFTKKASGGWQKIGDTASTTYTHTGLVNQTDYRYTVRALDKNNKYISGFDEAGYTARYYDTPVLAAVTNRFGCQRLSWTSVGIGVRYKAFVREGSAWKSLGTTVSTYIDNTRAESGESYTYTVRAVSNDGKEYRSYFDVKGISALYVAAPAISGLTPIKGGVTVAWNAEKGAVKYRLFYKTNASWQRVGDTADTSLNHTGLTDGVAYTYTVRALDKNNKYISDFDPAGVTHTYLDTPQFTDIGYANGAYQLSWNADERIAGFRVYRRTFGGSWKSLGDFYGETVCQDQDADLPVAHTIRGLDADGNRITYFVDNGPYYYHGAPADGAIKVGSSTVYFSNGRVKQGYVKSGGKTYYYNANGVLVKNNIVGSKSEGYTYADKNGVCCTSEEIKLGATFMMKYCKGNTLQEKMKYGFMYLAKNFPYRRTYDHPSKAEDIPALAIDMFTNEKGNCFRYAACFTCLARIAGYRVRMVIGTTAGNPHGWVEVLVDGQWLICDPDANIPGYGRPDYAAYMMKHHYWQLTARVKSELVIDGSGKAVWK